MNPNYNLMRLANLYGGMNKYATGEEAAAAAVVDAAAQQAELEKARKLALAAQAAQEAGKVEAAVAAGAPAPKAAPASAMDTLGNYWNKAVNWSKENPLLAGGIGAGALGLGGLGAYYAMKDDEEEEGRKKTAGYIDPYVAQVLAHDYITKMASANGLPTVAAGVTGLANYLSIR